MALQQSKKSSGTTEELIYKHISFIYIYISHTIYNLYSTNRDSINMLLFLLLLLFFSLLRRNNKNRHYNYMRIHFLRSSVFGPILFAYNKYTYIDQNCCVILTRWWLERCIVCFPCQTHLFPFQRVVVVRGSVLSNEIPSKGVK